MKENMQFAPNLAPADWSTVGIYCFISVTVQWRRFTVILVCQDESLLLPLHAYALWAVSEGR